MTLLDSLSRDSLDSQSGAEELCYRCCDLCDRYCACCCQCFDHSVLGCFSFLYPKPILHNSHIMLAKEFEHRSTFATLPRTTRGLPFVLGGDPKGKNFLYCNGNSVIIRNIENPALCDVYTEHSVPTTVAKYAPSGFYIASGDQSGKVRIWDTTQTTHILKAEYQHINGAIRDIAWSPDSQRMAVVGEGRERFGHVFLFDTGTSNGSLSGQSKSINSVEFRPTKPLRIITASEDNTVGIFEGPPFKFKNHFQQHTRFAHSARYAPDGSIFASVGADGKIFLYEGGEGTPQGELVDGACKGNGHGGSIYGLSWSPDGRQILTCSGDKTCKLWDVGTKALVSTFNLGSEVEDMQLSCLWQGSFLLAVSLNGFITYLDINNPAKPVQVVKGHNKPITALALNEDKSKIYTADIEGSITFWDSESGDTERIGSTAKDRIHKSQIQGMKIVKGNLASAAMDDTLAITSIAETPYKPNRSSLKSQPRGVDVSPDGSITALSCFKDISIFRNGSQVLSHPTRYEPTCICVHPDNEAIAVGGLDSKVHIYKLAGGLKLEEGKELQHHGEITCVAFSPDGKYLAVSDAARRVVPYSLPDYQVASSKEWTFHTARVNCLAWHQDSRHLVSGSLDTSIIVWDLDKSGEHPIIIKGAHSMSQITGVDWLDNNTVVSTGQDSNVKTWTVFL